MTTTVTSSQTVESIFLRECRSGMWSFDGSFHLWTTGDADLPYAVGREGVDYEKAARFATIDAALTAFPRLRAFCEKGAAIPTWEDHLRAALSGAAARCGSDITGLDFEMTTLDSCWGDLVGLVFWGAADDVNQRAAAFGEKWLRKHGREFGLFGRYEAQGNVGLCGVRYYTRYDNGANGWYTTPPAPRVADKMPALVETRMGHSVSFVYYPCAD